MANADSMFLVELCIENFQNYMFCNDFDIKAKFADVFKMILRKPNRRRRKKARGYKDERKETIEIDIEDLSQTEYLEMKLKTGEAVLLPSNILKLNMQMKTCPLELMLWRRNPPCPMGSTKIPWNHVFWSYLSHAYNGRRISPVSATENVDFYNDTTFQLVASARINIKLSYLRYRVKSSQPQVMSDEQKLFGDEDDMTPSDILKEKHPQAKQVKRPKARPILEPLAVSPTYREIKESFQEAMNNIPPDQKFIFEPREKQPYIVEELNDIPKSKLWSIENTALQTATGAISESTKSSYTTVSKSDNEFNRLTILSLTKSETKFTDGIKKLVDITRSRSISAFDMLARYNPLDYILLNKEQHFADQQYTVGYMAVVKKVKKPDVPREKREDPNACACKSKTKPCVCADNIGKIADPCVVECKGKSCERDMLPPPDDRILLGLTKSCCKVQELHGEMKASIRAGTEPGEKPCECTCSCTFDFVKKTTYCKICGGYETTKGDLDDITVHPCPLFHKEGLELLKENLKSAEGKKKRKAIKPDDKDRDLDESRFKFNYGYQGIPPHIGHAHCGFSCIGADDGPVPRNMGWLWTSENIPGIKFRPAWRPGAILKFVLKQLNTKQPLPHRGGKKHVPEKRKKRKEPKKKNEKKPMLTVTKKDGEYIVTMETAKIYTKPRLLNQYPYEDKPPVTYMIGRTDAENKDRSRHLARQRKRLAREQREYIQSAFRDVCREICVRTYQQALGILPGFEDPRCACPPDPPVAKPQKKRREDLPIEEHEDDCSCSDCASTEPSTDNDEWVVEFTPPNVKFQPGELLKRPVPNNTASTQYTYQDYQVKLVDRYGNPVPRYFRGPDGNRECSDLGGFWGPNDKWQEINQDGYIGPDGRWAPMWFKSPEGETIDISDGKYQTLDGQWLIVGVDGYIDEKYRWRSYGRGTNQRKKPSAGVGGGKKSGGYGGGGGFTGGAKTDQKNKGKSEASWSCFGDASPPDLAKLGVTGHGHDKKILMTAIKDLVSRDKSIRIPDKQHVPRAPPGARTFDSRTYFEERYKCHHPEPSEKGVVAVDDQGNKTYFKMNYGKNKRPKQRVDALKQRGISVSSFHAPCFRSFINSEIMRQQLRERRFRMAGINMATQK